MISETFISGAAYFDSTHFPHGFHRGGEFNKAESEILTRCGQQIRRLIAGELAVTNTEHENMLLAIKGERSPDTPVERAWLKYLNVIDRKRSVRHISLGGSIPANSPGYEDFAAVV